VPDVQLLANLGIGVGTQVAVHNRYALGGPVLLRVDGVYYVAIGKEFAKRIEVVNA